MGLPNYSILTHISHFLLLIVICTPSFAQQVNKESVEPAYDTTWQHQGGSSSAVRYDIPETLKPEESHILSALSPEERQIIAQEINPPAIGILRFLPQEIAFRLTKEDIPTEGSTTYQGGRLEVISRDMVAWTTLIKSSGAAELRIFFAKGYIPDGIQVMLLGSDDFVYQQSGIIGEIDEHGFYTSTVFEDQLYLQVLIPLEALDNEIHFNIPGIIHVDPEFLALAVLDDCYEDVNCPYASAYAGITDLKQSTARLTFLVGQTYYLCSGGLLNDSRSIDFQPFLLTANHCFSTQASATSLEARFDRFTLSCDGTTNPNTILVTGSNLLATNSLTDVSLVLLYGKPGGSRTYLGWTTTAVTNNAVLHAVHHPGGIPQKYSRHQNKTVPTYNCSGIPTSSFYYTNVLGGQTAGGSSGGILVNASGQVIGQLYGACHPTNWDRCDYTSYHNIWGRFDASYSNNNFQYWLNGGGSNVSMLVSPASSLAYGTIQTGSHMDLSVSVTNNGSAPNYLNLEAGIISINGTDANQFAIVGATSVYLRPGQSSSFTIRFAPTSGGLKSANLLIPHNAGNLANPLSISLTGSGTAIVNPCDSIIVISGCGPTHGATYLGGGTGVWNQTSNNACGYTSLGKEQIYSFIAPYTGTYSIQVSQASGYVDYLWKSGTCSSSAWNCIGDVINTGQYGNMAWTAGTVYYILLDDENSTPGTHSFYISCPEVCKTCPTYDFSLSPSTSWQTHSYTHVEDGCVIYRVNVTNGMNYRFKTGCGDGGTASYNTQLTLYNGSCALISSDDDGCELQRSHIFWTANYSGYAYLKIKGQAQSYGSYTLAYIRCESLPQPGPIAGNLTPCAGTVNVYSISALQGATSYTWSLPQGWSGSSNSTSITATTGSNSGSLSVSASNACGNSPSQTTQLTITPLPDNPGSILGPDSVCEGWEVEYTVNPAIGADSYIWTIPAVWTGQSDSTVLLVMSGSTAGTVSVMSTNICGNSAPSNLTVQGLAKPPKPIISLNGTTFMSDAPSGNQWHDQNGPISGATQQTFVVTQSGSYYSIVSTNNCLSDTSNIVQVSIGPTIGGCCYGDSLCNNLDSLSCILGGGLYMGDGIFCLTNPCGAMPDTIHGLVAYANSIQSPLPGIKVYLTQQGSILDSTSSGTSGQFSFLAWPGQYTLHAHSTQAWIHGASNASDALEVMKHFTKTDTLTEVYLLAADVNNSQSVNSGDALQIAQRFVGSISSFAAGDWASMPKDITMLSGSSVNVTIPFLLFGDVNATYLPSKKAKPGLILNTEGFLPCAPFTHVKMPVYSDLRVELAALSLALNYPSENFEITEVTSNFPAGQFLYSIKKDEIRIAWYNLVEALCTPEEPLMWIDIKVKDYSAHQMGIPPFSLGLESEAVGLDRNEINPLMISIPRLEFQASAFHLHQNRPNPFEGKTEIAFFVPEEGRILIQVMNALGQTIATLINEVVQAGSYQIPYDCRACPDGIYFCHAVFQGSGKLEIRTQKMIIRP